MDCQMEWKSNTESVIAKLMGLDQLRCPRQHVRKNRRVLSDGYIHKAASIGKRNGSLVSIGCKNENADVMKSVSGIVPSDGKDDSNLGKRSVGKKGQDSSRGNDVGYMPKPEHDLVSGCQDEHSIDYMNRKSKFGLEMVVKPSIVERELEKVAYGFKDGKFGIHSKSEYREQNEYSRPENCIDVASYKGNCTGCARNMNTVPQKLPSIEKFAEVLIPGYAGGQDMEKGRASHLSPNQQPPKMQHIGRRTRTKVVRRIEFSDRGESPEMLALADKESMVGKVKDVFSSGWSLKQENYCHQFKSPQVVYNAMLQLSKISDQDIEDEMNIVSENDKSLALVDEFSEESTYSNSSRIGTPEFQENLKRTHQHSPDSVLEPFYGQYYLTDHQCFDNIGLQLQLQLLNLETEDSYSDGSMMGVSGDNDSEEQFSDLPSNGRNVKRWLGDEESRRFSYMVDVLDEAGFRFMKSRIDFNTWHSLECPLSPSVFEALEKKYGKQPSWQESDRRLLFDHINSGLLDIFNPVVNFYPSIKRTLCANMTRDEVEDRLWTMLINVEKDKTGKPLEEWFEAEEGTNIMVNELTTLIFDELIDEFASFLF